jgi:hypothetical protein
MTVATSSKYTETRLGDFEVGGSAAAAAVAATRRIASWQLPSPASGSTTAY